MDLVKEHLGVQSQAGIRVGVLRLVAQHAHVHAAPRSAVRRQLIVAGVAARRLDDVVNVSDFRAVGNKIIRGARIVGGQVIRGQTARSINANGMRRRRIEAGRRGGMKDILILTGSDLRGRPARVRARLLRRSDHCARSGARGIRRIVFLIVGNHRRHVAQADRPRRAHTGRIQRQSIGIGDGINHRDGAIARDARRVGRDRQTRQDELDRGIVQVKRLLMRRIRSPRSTRQAHRDQAGYRQDSPLLG